MNANELGNVRVVIGPAREAKIHSLVAPLRPESGGHDPEADRQLQQLHKMSTRFQSLEEDQGAIYARILAFEQRLKLARTEW